MLQANSIYAERYVLKQLLGRGGFAEVWLAEDEKTKLEVALKIYASGSGLNDEGIRVFMQEFSLVFNLNHPNLLRASHFDETEGMPYLVLPFCEKGSCASLVGNISEQEIWKLIYDVASGLEYLHQKEPPIIHQDIKPDNILCNSDGRYLISDFGISTKIRSTLRKSVVQKDVISGTLAYMAPERFSADKRPIMANDIWSLGATLYELLCGEVPFGEEGGLMQKRGADIPNVCGDYTNELNQLVRACLSEESWMRPTATILCNHASGVLANGDNSNGESGSRQTHIHSKTDETVKSSYKAYNQNDEQNSNKKINRYSLIVSLIVILIRLLPIYGDSYWIENCTYTELYVAVLAIVILIAMYFVYRNKKGLIIPTILVLSFYWGYVSITAADDFLNRIEYDNQLGPIMTPDLTVPDSIFNQENIIKDNNRLEEISNSREPEDKLDKQQSDVSTQNIKKYDQKKDYIGCLAAVRLNGKWGFVDKSDNIIIPLKYDDVGWFDSHSGSASVKFNGKWGFIDKNDNIVISLKYEDAKSFDEGFASVKLNGKWGFIDKNDNVVIPLKYDMANWFFEGFANVQIRGKWGYIDKNGNIAIPLKYDYASRFSEGLAAVKLNGKWGYIDKHDVIVIPFKYDDADVFSNGKAKVKFNGKDYYCIDKQGKLEAVFI